MSHLSRIPLRFLTEHAECDGAEESACEGSESDRLYGALAQVGRNDHGLATRRRSICKPPHRKWQVPLYSLLPVVFDEVCCLSGSPILIMVIHVSCNCRTLPDWSGESQRLNKAMRFHCAIHSFPWFHSPSSSFKLCSFSKFLTQGRQRIASGWNRVSVSGVQSSPTNFYRIVTTCFKELSCSFLCWLALFTAYRQREQTYIQTKPSE